MEEHLHKRDHTGVQDFVLLEDFTNHDAFLDNLRKRFQEDLIYTYIGPVLVSVNPYHELDIYSQQVINSYKNVNFYELPPHVYAIADSAYRSMRGENRDQCILISGESGAGKTEASKKILHYIAASSTHSREVERVKDRLLQSNPLLEAFGNAKTTRNDNSSRFGKYMDIQFDFKGAPIGGHILNYLLEKSRVIHQAPGERNFHIFYQLLVGAKPVVLNQLKLESLPENYHYTNQGDSSSLQTMDDLSNWQAVQHSLDVLDFSQQEQYSLFTIVASVLHLGNVKFVSSEESDHAEVVNVDEVNTISELLGCKDGLLLSALQNKTIEVNQEKMKSPLSVDQAVYARDALAKGIYDRLFTWIVKKINLSLSSRARQKCSLMGLLDIYGFEIFQSNFFEQFCINYCNEKLQQLFIELTLKSEQEEYQREGIQWEPVKYFNNKIICDLIEARPLGIISVMDEECLRPGDTTDQTFLDKLSEMIGKHPHFVSHSSADTTTRKTIARNKFRLLHYAGDVTYNIKGFLDKNNDLLFRDLKEAMSATTNMITCQCFPKDELVSKKRPDTAATQFKVSLAQLMDILMSKEPSYVRCIKPNDYKRAGQFDEKIVSHQVKYLGLMENLRVRRAGFAYRRPYEVFLKRYKSLCPDTWPSYPGSAKDGVQALVSHLQYIDNDYRMGKTKLFIRFPRILFATEDAFQHRKHQLATQIQAKYRAYHQREIYKRMKISAILVQCYWRRFLAKKLLERRKWAAQVIRKFVTGFKYRNDPECDENRDFIKYTKINFLLRLAKCSPRSVLDKSWMGAPKLLQQTSEYLEWLCMRNLVLRYVKRITPARKLQMQEKVVAEKLFKGKKDSYKHSVKDYFSESRLAAHHEALKTTAFNAIKQQNETVKYCTYVTKYDRHGYKTRKRVLFLTDTTLYVMDEKDFKVKDKVPYTLLNGIMTSSYTDGIFVIVVGTSENGTKGDIILQSDNIIETLTKLIMIADKESVLKIASDGTITHDLASGKQGCIEFSKGDTYSVKKGKNGQLCVVALTINNEQSMDREHKDQGMDREQKDRDMDREQKDRDMDREQKDRDMDREQKDRDMDGEQKDRDMDREQKDQDMDREQKDRDMDREQKDQDMDREQKDQDMDREQKDRDMDREQKDQDMDREQKDRDMDREQKDRDMDREQKDRDMDHEHNEQTNDPQESTPSRKSLYFGPVPSTSKKRRQDTPPASPSPAKKKSGFTDIKNNIVNFHEQFQMCCKAVLFDLSSGDSKSAAKCMHGLLDSSKAFMNANLPAIQKEDLHSKALIQKNASLEAYNICLHRENVDLKLKVKQFESAFSDDF